MRLIETRRFLTEELSYPVDHATVVEQIGSIEIEAPDQKDTETVSAIIEPVGRERYGSADELFETLIGNVSDEYIGRKFYDDRGGNPEGSVPGPRDEIDVSF